MLLDALFRSESLENPATPISGDLVDTEGLFKADVYVSPETAMKLAAVYACIYVLSSNLAQMPLHVMRKHNNKVEPARDHPAFYMIHDDPRTTTELIDRWERLCGLPDECIPAGTQTLRQRQQRLDAKVNLIGGINEDFFLAQLAALGKPGATITRYDKSTFTCTSACTDGVYSPDWRYYWQVNMPSSTSTTWMTCNDPCNSALRVWGDTVVECVLNKLCPSHTYVIFKYPE